MPILPGKDPPARRAAAEGGNGQGASRSPGAALVRRINKSTVLSRLLLATLLPVVVLCLVTLAVYTVIRNEAETDAIETTLNFADQLSTCVSEQFSRMSSAVLMTRENLERLDVSDPNALNTADRLLVSMLQSVPGAYNVWFAFEPGVFPSQPAYKSKRFTKSYVFKSGSVEEVFDIPDEVLDDPQKSPWCQSARNFDPPCASKSDPPRSCC